MSLEQGSMRTRDEDGDVVVDFSERGASVSIEGASFSLELCAWGRGDALEPVASAHPVAVRRNGVEYRRGALTERYTNGPLGVHQVFLVESAPPSNECEPLTLALAVGGHESIEVDPTADGATLTANGGAATLRYSGLLVWDVDGTPLPARLELRASQLLVRVDDHGARYPILVDPWVQKSKLRANDGAANDALGRSVAVNGNVVVVGSPNHGGRGAVYVYEKPGGGWAANMTQTAKLTASDGAAGDLFGFAVGMSGDVVVVGSPQAKIGNNAGQGAAYVFVKPGGGWVNATETAKLTAANGAVGDLLGNSVAIDGTTIVAGATPGMAAGQAYVFVKPAGQWANANQDAILTPSDAAGGRSFGSSIAVSGSVVAVGCPDRMFVGSIYVFVKPQAGWANATEKARLIASDSNLGHGLGTSVSVSGTTVVGGAPGARIGAGAVMGPFGRMKKIPGNPAQGAVYLFVEPQNGWAGLPIQTAKLTASDGHAGSRLGTSVAIDGNNVVGGAPGQKVGNNVRQGAAYVFEKPAGAWPASATENHKLVASDGAADDAFHRIAIHGATIVVGAPDAKIGNNAKQGAAYVYEFQPPAPLQAFCFGDGSGAECPCGHVGEPRAGCANSFGSGAVLSASGSASLAANDLVLRCDGMLPGATCAFFQSSASSNGATPFTDGLFCLSGSLVKLGSVGARSGTASVTNIALRGAVSLGAPSYYQAIYQDRASFCTPSSQNTSNGVIVHWTP